MTDSARASPKSPDALSRHMRPHTRRLLELVLVLAASLTAGCSAHGAAVTNPCPVVTKQGAIVASPSRGAIALAKVGLTPKTLKTQQDCG